MDSRLQARGDGGDAAHDIPWNRGTGVSAGIYLPERFLVSKNMLDSKHVAERKAQISYAACSTMARLM